MGIRYGTSEILYRSIGSPLFVSRNSTFPILRLRAEFSSLYLIQTTARHLVVLRYTLAIIRNIIHRRVDRASNGLTGTMNRGEGALDALASFVSRRGRCCRTGRAGCGGGVAIVGVLRGHDDCAFSSFGFVDSEFGKVIYIYMCGAFESAE